MALSADAVDVVVVVSLVLVAVAASRMAEGRYLLWVARGAMIVTAILSVWCTRANVDEYPLWLPIFVGAGISLAVFAAAGWTVRRELGLAAQGVVTLAAGLAALYVVPLIAYLLWLAASSLAIS
jgi:FtsH-binding integral membrane protein